MAARSSTADDMTLEVARPILLPSVKSVKNTAVNIPIGTPKSTDPKVPTIEERMI